MLRKSDDPQNYPNPEDLSRNLTLKRHSPGARQKLPGGRPGGVPAVPKHRVPNPNCQSFLAILRCFVLADYLNTF